MKTECDHSTLEIGSEEEVIPVLPSDSASNDDGSIAEMEEVEVNVDKIEEEESAVKPLWRHCCPNYRVLYMKEGEIRLLGIHVSSKKYVGPPALAQMTSVLVTRMTVAVAPAKLLGFSEKESF